MGIFNIKKNSQSAQQSTQAVAPVNPIDTGKLADLALKTIQDGILIVNKDGVIKYINPAAVTMIGCEKQRTH